MTGPMLCWWLLTLGVVMEARSLAFQDASPPSLAFSLPSNDRYQSWWEWVKKRGLGGEDRGLGAWSGLDDQQFLRWGDLFHPLSPRKRQLPGTPDHFGLYNRYFTNGLQDWRSTFNGIKK